MRRLLRSRALGTAANCLLLALGLLGTADAFLAQLRYPYRAVTLLVVALAGALFAALFLAVPQKYRARVLVCLAAAWLLAGFILMRRLLDGLLVSVEYLLPDLGRVIAYDFGDALAPTRAQNVNCTLWLLYLLVPYAGVFTWAVAVRKSALLAVFLSASVFSIGWVLAGLPGTAQTAVVFVFWVAMLLRGRLFRGEKPAEAALSMLCLAVAGVLVGTLFTLFPGKAHIGSNTAYAIRDDLVGLATDLYDGVFWEGLPGFAGGAPLTGSNGNINLNATGSLHFSDRDILRVHADTPQDLYLRAYAASEYTGTAWRQADPAVFDGAGIGFDPLLFLKPYLSYDGVQPQTVTVEVLRGNPQFLFTPYLLAGAGQQTGELVTIGDAMLASGGRRAYSVYSFDSPADGLVISGSPGWFSPPEGLTLKDFFVNNYYRFYTNYSDSVDFIFNTYRFEGHDLLYQLSSWGPVFFDNKDFPFKLQEPLIRHVYGKDSGIDAFEDFYPSTSIDSDYVRFIREEYTRLPEGLGEKLLAWRQRYHLQRDSRTVYAADTWLDTNSANTPFWSWAYVASRVAADIQASATYTSSPGAQPRNRDFVEYFLMESQRGYCVHFASATVLMLRALGIPARYAEGYVLGSAAFGEDGWADVPSGNAHAWAEIWVPSLGWVPVESTPGGTAVSQDILQVSDTPAPIPRVDLQQVEEDAYGLTDGPLEDDPVREAATPTRPQPPAASSTPGAPEKDKPGKPAALPPVAAALLAALGGCAALAGLLLLYRRLRRQSRARKFADSDSKRAALAIYAYLDKLTRYGHKISPAATAIATKARFSRHDIPDRELAAMRREVAQTRQWLRDGAGPGMRLLLWLQVI